MTTSTQPVSQAQQPHGIAGWLFGELMAFLNDGMNQRAVALMDVQPGDHVLEIGCGHGKNLRRFAAQAHHGHDGFVVGIDISEVMVKQARWHNRAAIRAGRVKVQVAGVSGIPYPNEHFDKICAVNTFQFWPNPEQDLLEVRRVLLPSGRFLLMIRGKDGASNRGLNRIGASEEDIARARAQLEGAGLVVTKVDRARVRFMTAVALLASKS